MQIDLVTRQSVFDANPVLARALYDWQKSAFDPTEDPYYAGQDVWDSDIDGPAFLTEEKAAEWNSDFEAFCADKTDRFDPVPPSLQKGAYCVAELNCASFEEFAGSIAAPTVALFESLSWDRIIMVGFSRTPYLDQDNDAAQVAAAEDRLLATGLSRDYSGAISAEPESAAKFLADYFWIARCNASAPYLYVSAPGASTLLVPCKHANYHVETYAGGDAPEIEAALQQAGFTLAPDGVCDEYFSDSGEIPDRKLQI